MKEKGQSKRKREGKEGGESEKFQCELFGIYLFWGVIFRKKGLPCLQSPLLLPFVVSPVSRLKAKECLWNELDFWPSKEPSRTLRTPTSGSLETIQAGGHPPTPPTPGLATDLYLLPSYRVYSATLWLLLTMILSLCNLVFHQPCADTGPCWAEAGLGGTFFLPMIEFS